MNDKAKPSIDGLESFADFIEEILAWDRPDEPQPACLPCKPIINQRARQAVDNFEHLQGSKAWEKKLTQAEQDTFTRKQIAIDVAYIDASAGLASEILRAIAK